MINNTRDYFPKGNIEWNKIPAKAAVALVISQSGQWWIVQMPGHPAAVPFWSGSEAFEAQKYLKRRQSEVIDLRK